MQSEEEEHAGLWAGPRSVELQGKSRPFLPRLAPAGTWAAWAGRKTARPGGELRTWVRNLGINMEGSLEQKVWEQLPLQNSGESRAARLLMAPHDPDEPLTPWSILPPDPCLVHLCPPVSPFEMVQEPLRRATGKPQPKDSLLHFLIPAGRILPLLATASHQACGTSDGQRCRAKFTCKRLGLIGQLLSGSEAPWTQELPGIVTRLPIRPDMS